MTDPWQGVFRVGDLKGRRPGESLNRLADGKPPFDLVELTRPRGRYHVSGIGMGDFCGKEVSFNWMLPPQRAEGVKLSEDRKTVQTVWAAKALVQAGDLVPCVVQEGRYGLVATPASLELYSAQGSFAATMKGAFADYRVLVKGMLGLACAFLVSVQTLFPDLTATELKGPPVGEWVLKCYPSAGGELWTWGAQGWTDYREPLERLPDLPAHKAGCRYNGYAPESRQELAGRLGLVLRDHEYLFHVASGSAQRAGGGGHKRA